MPALWQSSQRPMYIRTVWVDGFRHAILTHDDPHFEKIRAKRRRPHSSASCAKSLRNIRSSLSHRDLGACYRKLNLVVRNEREPRVEKLDLSDVENCEEFVVKASPQPLCDVNKFRLSLETDTMRAVKSIRTARSEAKENTELSDRVLQWLDLAGKVNLLTENAERMTQPRHSWPEIQRRNLTKSKTTTDLRAKEPKQKDIETKPSAVIDRHEHYMTSANTIENYARQSRNAKITPRHDTKLRENKKVKDMKSIIETRQKVANERSAVERQYADLVNKKLIPDVGKTKKQVHIFMPEALNKRFNSTAPSVTGSMSQISSLKS